MMKLVVIGGGPGGNAAALAAARHGGGEVVLIEMDAMGGTCTNRGCIPTKFLLSRLHREPPAAGGGPAVWKRLMAHKRALLRGLSASIAASCTDAGVTIIDGRGRLTPEGSVAVAGGTGGEHTLPADAVIVATGSAPAVPRAFEVDGRSIITSTEALDLPEPPASIAIIGSGAVGSEFAFIFQRAGAKVTLIEGEERIFPGEDPEVAEVMGRVFSALGIDVLTGSPVLSATPSGKGAEVRLGSGEIVEADMALVGVGRRLLSDDIGLEEAGVARGPRGEVITDAHLRTSREGVFAVGDVTGRHLLAHLATAQGVQAAREVLGRDARQVPYDAVPWSIFTTPEIASVGLTEGEGRARGTELLSATVPWMDNIKARIDRETEGFVKINADAATGRIVGGTMVGSHSSDSIHIISSMIHTGLTAGDAAGMVFAHPGLAETIHDVLVKLQHALLKRN